MTHFYLFKYRMHISLSNKAIQHNHGKAVPPWLTPYEGEADMRGMEKRINSGIGA